MINSKVGILFCLLSVYSFSQAQPKNSPPPPPVAAEAKEISFDDLDLKTPEVKRNRVSNSQDSDASYSDAVRNLFNSTPQKENSAINQPTLQNSGSPNDNSSARNTVEDITVERVKFLYGKDQLKEALAIAQKMASSSDVLVRADGLLWIAQIYAKDKSLNTSNRNAIDFLKDAAALNSVDAIQTAARAYASFLQVPFHRFWGIQPDDKQSEFFYKKLLDHPFANDQQKRSARALLQTIAQNRENAVHEPAVEYIQSPKRTHKLTVVCLDSEYVISFIDRPQGPWSDGALSNCRTRPISVTGDQLRVVRYWYRGSQRSKATYIVRINSGSQVAFSFIDVP